MSSCTYCNREKLLAKHAMNSLLWASLLKELQRSSEHLPEGVSVAETFRKVVPVLLLDFRMKPSSRMAHFSRMAPPSSELSAAWLRDLAGPDTLSEFALFVANALGNQLETEASQMLETFQKAVSIANIHELQHIFLPFISGLPKHLTQRAISLSKADYASLFAATVTRYLRVFVGRVPPPGTNRSRPGTRCSCGDCAMVNAFLANETAVSEGFKMGQQRAATSIKRWTAAVPL